MTLSVHLYLYVHYNTIAKSVFVQFVVERVALRIRNKSKRVVQQTMCHYMRPAGYTTNSIKHILVECPSIQDIREKYFMVSSVKVSLTVSTIKVLFV